MLIRFSPDHLTPPASLAGFFLQVFGCLSHHPRVQEETILSGPTSDAGLWEFCMDISSAIKWILFLAIVPMTFIWLRRSWRIFIKHDYAEVALKRGEAPPNPEKWASVTGVINLAAGIVGLMILLSLPLWVFAGIKIGSLHEYESWSAVAGSTLWIKVFADFIVGRQAHPFVLGRNKDKEKE
jgi:hypothetical protein